MDAMNDQVEHLEKAFDQLSRQLMLQQLYVDEQTRSREGSGLKQTRQVTQGRSTLLLISIFRHFILGLHNIIRGFTVILDPHV